MRKCLYCMLPGCLYQEICDFYNINFPDLLSIIKFSIFNILYCLQKSVVHRTTLVLNSIQKHNNTTENVYCILLHSVCWDSSTALQPLCWETTFRPAFLT